jgi:hypothetical protein
MFVGNAEADDVDAPVEQRLAESNLRLCDYVCALTKDNILKQNKLMCVLHEHCCALKKTWDPS